ncbi:MAG: DUF917 domain-containing protein [Candidatus Bathyarchaeota archaeon]|nr:DUF917 domain-containing protein [Candidatus Bathyarchaeota archaeon]MDH5733019.1 DUF917 domain-containing protein [Candidatus Bathyarchaeota archaeon]
MRRLNHQDLIDLVNGAAILSAGGGGDPKMGHKIVDTLIEEGHVVNLVDPNEVPNDAAVTNFACVGATTTVGYDSNAATQTVHALEQYVKQRFYAVIPVELGGFNTLAAVDVAARRGIPIVDADGAGRAVPEVHLKVYTIDNIPLAPMVVADLHARNVVIVKKTQDSKSAERIARILATEWDQSAYTARRILTGKQVKTSPILRSLSTSIRTGTLLRKAVEPIKAVLKETGGFKLFEGKVKKIERKTEAGFTWTRTTLEGTHEYKGSRFEFQAKNEVLVAYKDNRLVALAPDIIVPVHHETGKCITAEKIEKDEKLVILGIPTPQKWRIPRGLELWKDVLERSAIKETYTPIEQLNK